MKNFIIHLDESLRNSKQYTHDAELGLEYKDWIIEIDEEQDLIRIYNDKDKKHVKFWYKEEVIQAINKDNTTLEAEHVFDEQK